MITFKVDPQVAMDKLAALGTPRAIADHLAAEGITGRPGIARACPVARYLERATGVTAGVANEAWRPVYGLDLDDAAAQGIDNHYRNLPAAVLLFVGRFDRDAYPELIGPCPNCGRRECELFACGGFEP